MDSTKFISVNTPKGSWEVYLSPKQTQANVDPNPVFPTGNIFHDNRTVFHCFPKKYKIAVDAPVNKPPNMLINNDTVTRSIKEIS